MEKTFDIGVNEAERMRNRMNGLGVVNDLHGVFDALRPSGDVHTGGLRPCSVSPISNSSWASTARHASR